MNSDLVLDPRIRDWVLIPISIVMFLQGVLRSYIAVLFKADKKKPPARDKIAMTQNLMRSSTTRQNARWVPASAWNMRRQFLTNDAFKPLPEPTGDMDVQQLENMSAMSDMMKGNVSAMIPNMLSMAWVSYFFSGFVLVKLPFPLTDAFKPMLQRGIALSALDCSYVSSLSWYFINLFGMRGLFSVVLGQDNSADDAKIMEQQMSSMAMMGGGAGNPLAPQQNPNAPLEKEKNELAMTEHKFVVSAAELRLLQT